MRTHVARVFLGIAALAAARALPAQALGPVGLCPRAPAGSSPVLGFGPDDLNCSVVYPKPPTLAPAVLPGIMQNTTAFNSANGWEYAGGSDLTGAVTINDYYAWVVNSPAVTSATLTVYNRNIHNKDVGGAVFAMTYTQAPGRPAAADIHFIQVYSQSINGGPTTVHLDNDNDPNTPYYDGVAGASVERPGDGTAWFLDMPFECENNVNCALEGDEDHFADFQFGVYLATENVVRGVHTVTIHGGFQWGYSYSTVDARDVAVAPEPAAAALLAGGLAVLAGAGALARRRRWTDDEGPPGRAGRPSAPRPAQRPAPRLTPP